MKFPSIAPVGYTYTGSSLFAMWLNVKSVVQGKCEETFLMFMECDMQYYTFICPVLLCDAVCLYSVIEIILM